MSFLICNQIWLNSPLDNHQHPTYVLYLEKKQKTLLVEGIIIITFNPMCMLLNLT
jgi:hypothetical protein